MNKSFANFHVATLDAVKKWATFSGRTDRFGFFTFQFVSLLLFYAFDVLYAYLMELLAQPIHRDIVSVIRLIFYVVIAFPFIALTTRRLHDIGKSGWWQLISLTGIGFLLIVYWTCKKSTESNRHGEIGSDPHGGKVMMLLTLGITTVYGALIYYQAAQNAMAVWNWRYVQVEEGPNQRYEFAKRILRTDNENNYLEIAFICENRKNLGFVANLYERTVGATDPVPVNVKILAGQAGVLSLDQDDRAVALTVTTNSNQLLADLPAWFDIHAVTSKKIVIKTRTERATVLLTTNINDPVVERIFKSCGR